MKNLFSFLILLAISFRLLAQSGPVGTLEYHLSLAQAVELGMKNKIALKNQRLTILVAQNEEDKIRTKNLPQVNATLDARVNTQLQTQVISPQATGGNPTSDPIRAQFGTKYFNVLGVNLNQNIFNPSIHYDRLINQEKTELERLNLEKSEVDAMVSISEAYFDAAYKKVKWEASQYNFTVAHEQYQRAQIQYKQGTKLQIDLDKARLDERNAWHSSTIDSSQYHLSLRYLGNELTLPPDARIQLTELTDTIDSLQLAEAPGAGNRVEIRAERQQLSIYQLNRTKQRATHLPTVSLFGNYTVQQFNKNFNPADGRYWTPYNYIGLRVEIPVFDGFLKERNRQEFDFRIEQSQNNLALLNQQINYEVEAAQAEYDNDFTSSQIAKENYQLARDILKTDLVRLQAGTVLPVEVKNSEYAMKMAQSNYLNGLYQYLLSRIRLQKALGVMK